VNAADDLRDRLDVLAHVGARGMELTRPDLATDRRPWWRGRVGLSLTAAVAVAAVVGVGIALTIDGDGSGGELRTSGSTESLPTAETPAVVAVTYADGNVTADTDVDLRFIGPTGDEFARRNLSETADRGGGLLQPVPPGSQELVVTHHEGGSDVQCTQPFDARAADRFILRVQPPGDDLDECAPTETIAEWVADATTGPTGNIYRGLHLDEAEARAEDEGLTTRVVGLNGADLVVTMDLRPDRLDLRVFEDVVVAASLPTDPGRAP
jgi:hypothetical protein